MTHRKLTICAVFVALLFWVLDSFIHKYVYLEDSFDLLPADANELWMRGVIVVLILGLGIVSDIRADQSAAAEREKHDVFVATVSATQHILNNLLNQMQLVIIDTGETNSLSDESRELLGRSIREAKEKVDRLSSVTNLDETTIKMSVGPT